MAGLVPAGGEGFVLPWLSAPDDPGGGLELPSASISAVAEDPPGLVAGGAASAGAGVSASALGAEGAA
ncbi:MAG: hypothetical protein P4L84_20810, partial [Isosphaeraceae bacterium]|nr:hypothetical protein [Isosphaeraceae bacterium]